MKTQHPFEIFLEKFIPAVAEKSTQVNKAVWLLETTGSSDAADLKAALGAELRLYFNDQKTYHQLLEWEKDPALTDSLLKRQLHLLILSFKQNLIPKDLLQKIVQKEALLSQAYAMFRPTLGGKKLSDNDIRQLLKKEQQVEKRKKVWEASKEIGEVLAPQILQLVHLRNEAARSVGYPDYFQMQLEMQEVDTIWLKKTFEDLAQRSDQAYLEVLKQIQEQQSRRFGVSEQELGPWSWSEPFCQEDPMDHHIDSLVDGLDLFQVSKEFYEKMGIDVSPILERSDMFERPGKNQHAFCINIDRQKDVRTLNNVQSSIKWLETLLHELGHAIYELGFDPKLPWLLREPPHICTTEAIALIAGRQAFRYDALCSLVGHAPHKESLMREADESLKRRQLIFSRWVLVMTFFESELYRDPYQDLNRLWWKCVEKYQKIAKPSGRDHKQDWAAKYHIGLAPVYYFGYLMGEMLASALEDSILQTTGSRNLDTKGAGEFLQQKLFNPGNRHRWDHLLQQVLGKPLTAEPWIEQFGIKQFAK